MKEDQDISFQQPVAPAPSDNHLKPLPRPPKPPAPGPTGLGDKAGLPTLQGERGRYEIRSLGQGCQVTDQKDL